MRLQVSNVLKDELLAGLSEFVALKKLVVTNGSSLSDKLIEALSACKTLESLELTGLLTDACFAHLAKFPALKDLSIQHFAGTGENVGELAASGKLTRLELTHCRNFNAKGVEGIGKITSLKKLSLTGAEKLPDEMFAPLGNLTLLEELDLYGCVNLSDKGMAPMVALTELQVVSLVGNCKLNNACVEVFLKWTKLQTLNLRSSSLGLEAKEALAKATPNCKVSY
jgi:hypothetical protein